MPGQKQLLLSGSEMVLRLTWDAFEQASSNFLTFLFLFFVFLPFLGPLPRHMEVPRLGVESELQPPAYTTVTAMPDLNHICDLRCSSRQCQILNPLNTDQTQVLMDTSRALNPLNYNGNSKYFHSIVTSNILFLQFLKS